MRIIRNRDRAKLKKKAARFLQEVFLKENKTKPILLLLSGGSALELLPYVDASLLGANTTISVLDERWSDDSLASNFAKIAATEFYKEAKDAGACFIDTRVREGESRNAFAERFDHALKKWKRAHPDGIILATQGIGEDGHTAGIFPYPENPALFQKLFEDKNKWVVGYDAKEKNPYPFRVTVTLPFLRDHVDFSVVYLAGEEKRAAFEKVIAPDGTPWETPGRIVREMKDARIFTSL